MRKIKRPCADAVHGRGRGRDVALAADRPVRVDSWATSDRSTGCTGGAAEEGGAAGKADGRGGSAGTTLASPRAWAGAAAALRGRAWVRAEAARDGMCVVGSGTCACPKDKA